MSEIDIDLLYKCLKDAGAKLTPGVGKLFVDGKEVSVSEALDFGFGIAAKGDFDGTGE